MEMDGRRGGGGERGGLGGGGRMRGGGGGGEFGVRERRHRRVRGASEGRVWRRIHMVSRILHMLGWGRVHKAGSSSEGCADDLEI